jgi:hypothetical protein
VAGVGSLGSTIVNLWARAGWGIWTLIDPDHIKPHNLARHHAFDGHIGMPKAMIMAELVRCLHPTLAATVHPIVDDAANVSNPEIASALDAADIVVDVTTGLNFPRTIAARNTVKRAASAFITPSGLASVLLIEDANRSIRLDALECQYYRHVVTQPWGAAHLASNYAHLWTGGGCRDQSAVITNDMIALHGANLAGMIRVRAAAILLWHHDPDDGSLTASRFTPYAPRVSQLGKLKILWDDGIRATVRMLRERELPRETGGILLGYFDQVLDSLFIVDALPAPDDSLGERTGFIRGVDGLEAFIGEASRRTGQIVRYVGEWHSHPQGHGSQASGLDIVLLGHLAAALEADGLPAVMLIVAEADESWLTGRVA